MRAQLEKRIRISICPLARATGTQLEWARKETPNVLKSQRTLSLWVYRRKGDVKHSHLFQLKLIFQGVHKNYAKLTCELRRFHTFLDMKVDLPTISSLTNQNISAQRLLMLSILDQINLPPRRWGRYERPGSDDCMGVQIIRLYIDYEDGLFREIEAEIHNIAHEGTTGSSTTDLFPSYNQTQAELFSSSSFHIVVDGLPMLLNFIQISKMSDRHSLLIKHQYVKGEKTCRIAG